MNLFSPHARRSLLRRLRHLPLLSFSFSLLVAAALPHADAGAQTSTGPSGGPPSPDAWGYSTHAELMARMRDVAREAPGRAEVRTIGTSRGGREILLLELKPAGGSTDRSPALLVAGGVDGRHLAGAELAMRMAEQAARGEGPELSHRLVFVPLVNPDGYDRAFASPSHLRDGNDHPQDLDRDGLSGEDPFEDLDGNGLITWIRVEDPAGGHRIDSDDPRRMVPADFAKGEPATHRVLMEGVDNDGDGSFNEDGPGGVNIDRNFAFEYPIFREASGDYAASEPETRALMDALYADPAIYAVLTFGPGLNLDKAPAGNGGGGERKITALLPADRSSVAQAVELYAEAVKGVSAAPALPLPGGSFAQTAYYHAGRLSLATPGWWPPAMDGSEAGGSATGVSQGTDAEERLLAWADAEGLEISAPWTPVEHPDFPGRKAEAGGILPFAAWNPPVSYLEEAAGEHLAFLDALSARMPDLAFADEKVEPLGNGLYRVTVSVMNRGRMSTHTEIGDRIRWVERIVTEISLDRGQSLAAGRPLHLRDAMGPGESQTYSWLVRGKGTLSVEVRCATTGTRRLAIDLD